MGATRARARAPGDAATPKPTSDSDSDEAAADAPVARSGAREGGVTARREGDAAREARKRAAKRARNEATGREAADDASAATGGRRTCKLCEETKPVEAFPPRQLRKARSACAACCESQAAKDAPAPERKRKMTKREKLMEAIEARKKKRAEKAKEEDAEKSAEARVETKKPERKPREEDEDGDSSSSSSSSSESSSASSSASSSSSSSQKASVETGGDAAGLTEEELALRSRQVFVGGIPFHKTEEEIKEAFEDDTLTVDDVDCMTFPDSGRFRGIAIVTFASATIAKAALRWNDTEWDGMTLVVKPYEPKSSAPSDAPKPKGDVSKVEGQFVAFVANLDYSVSEEILRETFDGCDIKDVRMGVDKETGDFRGYAHIEFASDADLERAIGKNGEELIGGRAMKVTYATARKKSTPRTNAAGKPRFKGAVRRKDGAKRHK